MHKQLERETIHRVHICISANAALLLHPPTLAASPDGRPQPHRSLFAATLHL